MTRRMGVFVCIVLALAAGLTIGGAAKTVVDQLGNAVEVPESISRLASVYGIGTFYVYALGQGDRIVAGWYVGIKTVEKATDAMLRLEPRLPEILLSGDPNIEEICLLDPDLILCDWTENAAFAEQAMLIGIPVIQYEAETPVAIKELIGITADVFSEEAVATADAFTADYDRVFRAVTASVAALPEDERVRVLYIGTGTDRVASGDMYQRHLIEAAGGVCVSSDLIGSWNTVGLEQILVWNPDVIVIAPYGVVQAADVLDDSNWQAIGAVQSGRVYKMPRLFAPWDTPVPESILGVAWMAEQFYPGVSSIDFDAEVLHFYTDYYGFELTDDDWAVLRGE